MVRRSRLVVLLVLAAGLTLSSVASGDEDPAPDTVRQPFTCGPRWCVMEEPGVQGVLVLDRTVAPAPEPCRLADDECSGVAVRFRRPFNIAAAGWVCMETVAADGTTHLAAPTTDVLDYAAKLSPDMRGGGAGVVSPCPQAVGHQGESGRHAFFSCEAFWCVGWFVADDAQTLAANALRGHSPTSPRGNPPLLVMPRPQGLPCSARPTHPCLVVFPAKTTAAREGTIDVVPYRHLDPPDLLGPRLWTLPPRRTAPSTRNDESAPVLLALGASQ
jgi:hypothetical protein